MRKAPWHDHVEIGIDGLKKLDCFPCSRVDWWIKFFCSGVERHVCFSPISILSANVRLHILLTQVLSMQYKWKDFAKEQSKRVTRCVSGLVPILKEHSVELLMQSIICLAPELWPGNLRNWLQCHVLIGFRMKIGSSEGNHPSRIIGNR